MKHNFTERKTKRIEHAKAQAEKNTKLADQLHIKAKEMASAIPFGQPILIGHHSEKSDRNYRAKIHRTFEKSFEADEKASYYQQKAETIQNNDMISSDDPDALSKLKSKLDGLISSQEFMKAANKCIRKMDREAFLALPNATVTIWDEISTPNRLGHIGFATYALSNNAANIKRVKDRILQLEKKQSLTTKEISIGDVRIRSNVEANRLQLFFNSIPDEQLRKQLKQNGFRWSPSQGAWQRHLTPQALNIARHLLQESIPPQNLSDTSC